MMEKRYQVFVSSTFKDLEHERQKVLQAILEMRAFPAGMELFPSADDEQWEFIKWEIESSDYYIVVVAGKYGSIAPSSVSFTEMEYDYAVSKGKPVMGFLFHDLGELKGNALESEKDRRDRLEAFRTKVAHGKLIRKYRSEDDLKAQVIRALAHAFQFKPASGWVRANQVVSANVLGELHMLRVRNHQLEETLERLQKVSTGVPLARLDETVELSGMKPKRTPAEQYHYEAAKKALEEFGEHRTLVETTLRLVIAHGTLTISVNPTVSPVTPPGMKLHDMKSYLNGCVEKHLVIHTTGPNLSGGVTPVYDHFYTIAPAMKPALDELLFPVG